MTYVPAPSCTSVYPTVKWQAASCLAVGRWGLVKDLAERLDDGAIRRMGLRTS